MLSRDKNHNTTSHSMMIRRMFNMHQNADGGQLRLPQVTRKWQEAKLSLG